MTDYKVPVYSQFEYQPPVIDKDLTAPPGGESKGDRYIVASGGSGAWSGEDGNIAMYNGSGWDFADRREGMLIFVKDENVFYLYITSWAQIQHGTLGGVTGDQHHAEDHAASHSSGQADKVNHDNLAGFVAAEHLLVGAIDHNSLLNYAANRHVVLPGAIANVLSDHDLAVHNALNITELGTVSSGVWQGSAISNNYIAGLNQNCLITSSPQFAKVKFGAATPNIEAYGTYVEINTAYGYYRMGVQSDSVFCLFTTGATSG